MNARNAIQVRPHYVPQLALILRTHGFVDPFFQEWRIGQRFGLSRSITEVLEWHVRGFADGTLDSEVEVSRKRLQHIASRPGPYYSPLIMVLRNHGIPFRADEGIPPDATHVYLPELFGRTVLVRVPQDAHSFTSHF